jgi:hypothetical protein
LLVYFEFHLVNPPSSLNEIFQIFRFPHFSLQQQVSDTGLKLRGDCTPLATPLYRVQLLFSVVFPFVRRKTHQASPGAGVRASCQFMKLVSEYALTISTTAAPADNLRRKYSGGQWVAALQYSCYFRRQSSFATGDFP